VNEAEIRAEYIDHELAAAGWGMVLGAAVSGASIQSG